MARFQFITRSAVCVMALGSVGLALRADAAATLCIPLPKAQLGQGNNAPKDVSEPVRAALSAYMAGPVLKMVPLDARIPVQIDAEAAQKKCQFVLQSSVAQKKGGGAGRMFKKMAPIAGALPMLGGMGGSMGGAMAAQAVASTTAQVAAQSATDDYLAAISGAQQSNVKRGDTIQVEYSLTKIASGAKVESGALERKAEQDGEDVLGPLLEQVATAVVTAIVNGK